MRRDLKVRRAYRRKNPIITTDLKEWRVHPTYDFLYANQDGRVFSTKSNKVVGTLDKRINRYFISIPKKTSQLRYRIVWECFNSLLQDDLQVDHKNSISTDDRIDNLQALTSLLHHKKTREQPWNKGGKSYLRNPENQEDLDGEIWKDGTLDGHKFTASNMGRLKCKVNQYDTIRITRGVENNKIYRISVRRRADISSDSFEKSDYMIHTIICTFFHGVAPSKHHQVNHKDKNTLNNRADNLEWMTSRENNIHSKGIAVAKCNLEGEEIQRYASYSLAADDCRGISGKAVTGGAISKCVNGKLKKVGGFIWKKV